MPLLVRVAHSKCGRRCEELLRVFASSALHLLILAPSVGSYRRGDEADIEVSEAKDLQSTWQQQLDAMAPIYKIAVIQLHPKVCSLKTAFSIISAHPRAAAHANRVQLCQSRRVHKDCRIPRRATSSPARIPFDKLGSRRPQIQ